MTEAMPKPRRRRWSKRKTQKWLIDIAAVTVLLIFALPAIWIVFTAFRPGNEINVTPPVWIPKKLTLDAFVPRCLYACSVASLPRGVLFRYPSLIRNGS